MKILIIGGTVFLGRAIVNEAQKKGHQITLFNRGFSNPGIFHELEIIQGDREFNLSALDNHQWDAVIDTCGYLPRIVLMSAEKLKSQVGLYIFISSLSVYADTHKIGITEDHPVSRLNDENIEEINNETYGPLKAACERKVLDIYQDKALIIRPGLIVGPHDPTDRFTYWMVSVSHSQEVLAPGRPERRIQFIDVRDLAEWIIRMMEVNSNGIFNAVGPGKIVTMKDLLETCDHTCNKGTKITWVSEEFLVQEGIEPWVEMPLWVPETQKENHGFFAFDNNKATRNGLTFRDIYDTIYDTCTWAETRPSDHICRAGINRNRQAALLEKWIDYQKG